MTRIAVGSRFALRAALVLGLTHVAACKPKTPLNSSATESATTTVVAATDTSLVMSLERGPCRGRCPVYRVDVYGDGKVRFDGKQHVGSLGAQSGTAPVEAVQALVRSIQSGEFATVDTSFVMGSAGCGQYVADLPMSKISAKVGAQMKTVTNDPGCRNAPRFLRTLEAQIDSVARTAQWIAGNGAAK